MSEGQFPAYPYKQAMLSKGHRVFERLERRAGGRAGAAK